jgi:Spermidine/putrescine-binding periplasmic protein
MKQASKKRMRALILALAMLAMMGLGNVASAQEQAVTTLTIYPANSAVPSGMVDGFKGEIFAERGLKLEIWAFSDEKTNAILASGDLPDVMYVTYDQLQTMIEGNMVLELDSYLEEIPLIKENETVQTALNYTKQYKSADTGKIYGIPMRIGKTVEGQDTGRNAVKVNWPVYYELGCPEVSDVWDLIPLMKQMMEKKPVADDGTPTWGTVLNAGADAAYFRSIEMWYKWFGFELDNMPYLIESDMINNKYESVLALGKDSLY